MRLEIKKLVTPMKIIVLVGIIISHWNSGYADREQKRQETFSRYSGAMNEQWKKGIMADYDEYMSQENIYFTDVELVENGLEVNEETHLAIVNHETASSIDFMVLDSAYVSATKLDKRISEAIQITKSVNSSDDAVDKVFASLVTQSDQLIFTYSNGWYFICESMKFYSRTMVVLLVVFFFDTSGIEASSRMFELVKTAKNGRKKLLHRKLTLNILVTTALWLIVTTVIFLRANALYGLGGHDGFMFDGIYNLSPYMLSCWQYILVQLLYSLSAAIVLTLMVTMISYYCKKTIDSFIICLATLLLPSVLLNQTVYVMLVYYAPFNIVAPDYLLRVFRGLYLGNIYVSNLVIAVFSLVLFLIGSYFLLIRRDERHNFVDSKIA